MSKITFHSALGILEHSVHRLGDHFQRRSGLWSPARLMTMLLLLKTPGQHLSYRSALAVARRFKTPLLSWPRVPSLGSMSKARQKLIPSTCRDFLQQVGGQVTRALHDPRQVWRGRRIIAIDGSRFVVPRSTDTLKHFKCSSGGHAVPASHHPRALGVLALDVLRRVPVDFVLGRKGQGEATLIRPMLDHFQPGDVVVVDRGFPSRALLKALIERNIDVVMRMSTSDATTWKEFRTFLKGNKKSAVITVKLGRSQTSASIRVRLVERDPQRGRPRKGTKKERMVILTTLTESDGFTREEIVKLYAARWGVETAFREMKTFLDVEPFHSKTANGVEQELAACLIWQALTSLLESTALNQVQEGYRVVRTDCYRFAGILLGDFLRGEYRESEFLEFVEDLKRYAQKRKPNRYAERTCNVPCGRSQKQFG